MSNLEFKTHKPKVQEGWRLLLSALAITKATLELGIRLW